MRLLRLFVASMALMAGGAAFAAEPKNGVDYMTLETPVRADTGKKVEVVEFFLYSCPHCNALEPQMAQWVKQQGDKIAFRRVHLMFSGLSDPQARAYTTLEAMGKLDLVHDKIFHAVHVERNRLNKDELLADFVAKNGVDKGKYMETLNSFGVQTKIKRNAQLIATYKIDSAPSIVIDGRFLTSPTLAGRPGQPEQQSQQATLQVMDALVAKAMKEKGAAPAKAAK